MSPRTFKDEIENQGSRCWKWLGQVYHPEYGWADLAYSMNHLNDDMDAALEMDVIDGAFAAREGLVEAGQDPSASIMVGAILDKGRLRSARFTDHRSWTARLDHMAFIPQ